MPSPLTLYVDTDRNRLLNQDGITSLRKLRLVNGETYSASLSFVGDVPNIDEFAFYIRAQTGTNNLINVTEISGDADGGYSFSLPLISGLLTAALGAHDSADLRGFISWTDGAEIELIEGFTVLLVASGEEGGSADYVSSVNSLAGAVTISGAGSVSVSTGGQGITVFGSSPDLSLYASNVALAATGSSLNASLATLAAQTGDYYPKTNPNGFISTIPADVVRTTGAQAVSGIKTFDSRPTVRGSGIATFGEVLIVTGNITQNISGAKRFYSGIFPTMDTAARVLYNSNGGQTINWANGETYDNVGDVSINWANRALMDAFGGVAVSWANQTMNDGFGGTSIDWTNRQLLSSSVPVVQWEQFKLADSNNVQSINWAARTLTDENGDATLNWNERTLETGWTVPTPAQASEIANKSYVDAGSTTLIIKTSDESVTSSNTLQNDNDLTFTVPANQYAAWYMKLFVTSASATPGFAFHLDYTNTPTISYHQVLGCDNTLVLASVGANNYTAGTYPLNMGAGTVYVVNIEGTTLAGASPSTMTLQWAQNTANGTATTVKAGSFVKINRKT